jgi:NAD(P)-dependent dehydrogenase (short-subunit alcohol dehydrogenase family)
LVSVQRGTEALSYEQTVLVAGATGNVGGGAAAALAKRGVHVVLLARDPGRLEAEVDSIRADPSGAGIDDSAIETLTVDFSDLDSVQDAATEALDRFPVIDGLVLSVVALVQGGPNLLPNGHELMFATNVLGPFLFTQLLLGRLKQSDALVVHVVAPFHEDINWDDIESIENHKTGAAYNRTKTMTRMIAAESARRSAGDVSSIAFNPPFVIDKNDPALKEKWPTGFLGLFWRVLTAVAAKPPQVAGEQLADVMLLNPDRQAINGAYFKRNKQVTPDKAMSDTASGQRLWGELVRITGASE